jgi:MFS family permease
MGTPPSAKRLLWAGFFSIFAAGVGFGVRGGILVDWAREYGFTAKELGDISGGGLTGFGIIIILGSLIADRVGYGTLMVFAFAMHVLSAVLQMCTGPIYGAYGREGVYWSLTAAMYMFSVANGTCEVVVNPMVAALFPREKTHYLNILHAGWPGGLIAGGVVGYAMNEVVKVHWIIQMSMFLIPVAIYGLLMLGQRLPRSEASQAGVSYGTMLAEFLSPVLLLLLFIHALVGFVELGTDSWIQKITGTITASRGTGVLLFIYTNILMFTLRFFAGPIEHRLSPLGLLFSCAVIASIGLTLLGNAVGVMMSLMAVSVYGVGKTFFWPTMLAVVSERFPRGGALTLGTIGGVGMLSAGLLGAPGIGFMQDHFASEQLRAEAPATFERYAVEREKRFLIFETKGLDGTKVGLLEEGAKVARYEQVREKLAGMSAGDPQYAELQEQAAQLRGPAEAASEELQKTLARLRDASDEQQRQIAAWWEENKKYALEDIKPVESASLYGGRMALIWTAAVPAVMAVLYLLLIIYFRLLGGYRRVEIASEPPITPR